MHTATRDQLSPGSLPHPAPAPPLAAASIYQPLPETVEELELRLADAGRTLMALAVRGTRPAGYRTYWPEVVDSAAEAYGYTEEDCPVPAPSNRAISRMDEAFRWVALIPLDPPRPGSGDTHSRHGGAMLRRVILGRCLTNPRSGRAVMSWRKLGKRLGSNHEAVRQWHALGLARILARLHGAPVPVVC